MKVKTAFVCENCGQESAKWIGRCPACGEWNTFKEVRLASSSSQQSASVAERTLSQDRRSKRGPVSLSDVQADAVSRYDLHDPELNRVLGGGLVPGSLILLGGEPGIGKSTLLLQTLLRLTDRKVLYSPDLLIIDSIQTMATETIDSAPGSLSQIRTCAAEFLKYAKSSATPVLLVGHIAKDGAIAGPKILEHIVDTVLQFEGDRHYFYRILRSIKNRFGSTDELGIYEMRAEGLRPVANPSELLLTEGTDELSGIAVAAAVEGARPFLIEVQALVSSAAYGTPQRSATGFDLRRLNMLLAVLEKRAGFKLGAKDVFLNIAGGLRVTDPAIDLSVIAAILSSNVDIAIDRTIAMAGEVGLSGEIRPVTRIRQRIAEAAKLGFKRFLLPEASLKGLGAEVNIQLIPVRRVEEALQALFR